MANEWIEHCKAYAKANNCSYKEAMSKAKPSYKKGSGKCCDMEGEGYEGDKIRDFFGKVKSGREKLRQKMMKGMVQNKSVQRRIKKNKK